MLYLTCTVLSSVDLACYGISRAKAWVSVDSGTSLSRIHTEVCPRAVLSPLFIASRLRSIFNELLN